MQVNANISAMKNAITMQEVSANNIANVQTNGFKASRVVQSGDRIQISPEARAAIENSAGEKMSTTDLGQDMVKMSSNKITLQANVAAIRTQADMQQALMDMKK
ncbi:MAG: hypothetical protein Q9M31_08990 [Mariprofundus sp.]|nr:hypothetical protein [Mariprofundus sp.]